MNTNEEMVERLRSNGVIGSRIAECMLKFPREDFLPPLLEKDAYKDTPLPISNSQTTSAPSMIGIMLREAEIEEGMGVLEVGTGSGWQTALLSCLTGKTGRVYTLEVFRDIHEAAKSSLSHLPNVESMFGDGVAGHPSSAPYDRIIVSAAASEPYAGLLSQLREGGIMIIPLRGPYFQHLYKITKTSQGIKKEGVCPVLFVPMYEGGKLPPK
ncbi:protein-L-isoaspartate(D-aspartate) O-methyltransferase [Candidatus Micrarchaeota archaeon]|nr:protein-L-isoaspartate(D-aspartate) O-methyltransferase [Candidatus Micrarchaeota archaeon]